MVRPNNNRQQNEMTPRSAGGGPTYVRGLAPPESVIRNLYEEFANEEEDDVPEVELDIGLDETFLEERFLEGLMNMTQNEYDDWLEAVVREINEEGSYSQMINYNRFMARPRPRMRLNATTRIRTQ
tara:strand:- start:779 stop:1156 length:378 start_codon:yes stop_codon:yes gene_type:complete